ncbi:putative sulfate exporter family transporter [Kribbella sandramycini]|uniref:Putative integral membrane protein (TIGR00698 family) n=1 Tax=Kribbella sandramycini TaxID=60450 RepID=A0A7Y4L285_9ACTN|nr:putative sulfate exporter family transporter [Kribbella sandramycini]MBB6566338.1 putative integral membrane protein (TIGR00698 family) [Kribbella sandramycini]NOL43000.1 putative sulfate exporter family transporter [Kribbella sandramycini]
MVQVDTRAIGTSALHFPRLLPRRGRLPGLLVVLVLAAIAVPLGRLVPVVGGPVFGIVLGVLVGVAFPRARAEVFRPGIDFASKNLLQVSIVVLGTGLSLQQVAQVGLSSLPVMLGTLGLALGGAWVFGRLLGVRGDTQILIGVGTAICGGSAIAAATAAIGAKRSSVAYALATIFTFNVVAVLTFPPLGHLLNLSPEAFGLWAGTAINDTSSVVAAGYAYSQEAGDQAIVVKLTRSLTLIPIVLTLVALKIRRENRAARALDVPGASYDGATASTRGPLPWRKLVPLFLIGFIAAAGLRSAGAVPDAWLPTLSLIGTCLITAALVAIGLSLRPQELRDAGPRPLVLGAILWALVAVGSLVLQSFS